MSHLPSASSLRRYASLAAVALAAVASVATSQYAPVTSRSGSAVLSAASPEKTIHIKVSSDGAQTITFATDFTWSHVGSLGPTVNIDLTADGLTDTDTVTQFPGSGSVTLTTVCDEGTCEKSYTAIIKGLAPDMTGNLDGTIDVAWTVAATGTDTAANDVDIIDVIEE